MSKIKDKQQKKRTEIIETAVALMDDTPFEELSVTEICEAAGISTGSFYHYFNRKTDILVGFLSKLDDDLAKNIFPQLTNENEIENLLLIAEGFAIHINEYGLPRSWPITRAEISDHSISGGKRALLIMLEKIILRGQQSGQIMWEKSPEELARFFITSLRAVSVDWTRRDGAYPIVDFMKEYISFILRAYAAKP